MTDPDLVTLAVEGRPEAFAEVVRRYTAPLFRYGFRLLGDRQLAEDLVQETFLRTHRSLATSRPDHLGAWLFGIARKCGQEEWRRQSRPAPSAAAVTTPREDPLDGALDRLDDDERALIHLKHAEGRTCQEIARMTGRPLGTITGTLARIYQKLRKTMEPVKP